MRVLMTADAVGGVWTYTMDLCRALAGPEIEITLATMGPPPTAAQQREAAELPRVTIHGSDFALEWMEDPWHDVTRAGQWLLALARSVRPDVVHLNGYAHAALPWSAPVLLVAHSCVYSWWHAVKGEAPPPRYAAYQRAVARGLRRADRVVAPTRTFLASLGRHYDAPPRGVVIHNGCATADRPAEPKAPVILSAGRMWDEGKNIAALDAAASGLPWEVRVAGPCEGPDGSRRALAHAIELGTLGRRELAAEMSRAAIFALPARYEPFGLTVLEAAVSGCALVLGDVPSLRELWDGAALFVAPDDVGALRRTLQSLIDHPGDRHRLAAAARERAHSYPIDRTAAQYERLYHVLAGTAGETPVLGTATTARPASSWDQARAEA